MTARDIMMAAGGASQEKLYVDDVFSTYLYTGNGTSQTINNGIDLSGKGGMVWAKVRNSAGSNSVYDTQRGGTKLLVTNSTGAENINSSNPFVSFNSNGFTFGTSSNTLGYSFVSWCFRCAPKFFDVVKYTGNAVAGRTVQHSLGTTPGLVIVKALQDTGGDPWMVWHRSLTGQYLNLNNTNQSSSTNAQYYFGNNSSAIDPSSSLFTVGTASAVNNNGTEYVAYLFANDSGQDGLIQCGSFSTDASGNSTILLGWEPQFVLLKASSAANGWVMLDSMRGMPVGGADAQLYPHVSNAEGSINTLDPTATGFNATGLTASTTYIYMAIRRPNKPPTSGAQVFAPVAVTSQAPTVVNAGFPVDLMIGGVRSSGTTAWFKRQTGSFQLTSAETKVEQDFSAYPTKFDSNTAVSTSYWGASNQMIFWNFRKAVGFFDMVFYTGTGASSDVIHGLAAIPELIITKRRDVVGSWRVYCAALSSPQSKYLTLETTDAEALSANVWPSISSSSFGVSASFDNNIAGGKFVAFLFATLDGVSKVGGYTGNGGSQTINCGFSGGARFVLIKRADAASDWCVWDTARGIVSSNDPMAKLNIVGAEITTNDSIDPDASGFIVNQVAATNINVSGGQYIFLAIA